MNPNDLHWTESNIESISVTGRELTVIASGLFVYGASTPRRFRVVFSGVSQATMQVTEYIGDPKAPEGFRAPYVKEEFEPLDMAASKQYFLEGVRVFGPQAWIDLAVLAQEGVAYEA